MYTDQLGRIAFTSKDIIEEIYRGNLDKIDLAKVRIDEEYLQYVEFVRENALDDWPIPLPEDTEEIDIEKFDCPNQHSWLMPFEYKKISAGPYLLNLCSTAEEEARVHMELELFEKHDMMDLLRFLIFLVDTLRANNILWGVGRGSSVASYCLYLLGIHKINSLKYQLDINEFLK